MTHTRIALIPLFAAACKARFFGSWTKALQAAEEPVAASV